MQDSAKSLEQSKPEAPTYLNGVFGVVDSGRLFCESCDDSNLHDSYFDGYTQLIEDTKLFVWNVYDEIINAAINYSDSCHDSKIAVLLVSTGHGCLIRSCHRGTQSVLIFHS